MLVPAGAAAGAWARCSNCRAFFQLKDANARELVEVELVESAGVEDHREPRAAKTQDSASLDTWVGIEKDSKLSSADKDESVELEHAAGHESETSEAESLDFADLEAMLGDDDLPAKESPSTPPQSAAGQGGAKSDELHVADVVDDGPFELDASTAEEPHSESREEAAGRIDAWFRSAKTVAEVQPLADSPSKELEHESKSQQREDESAPSVASTNATIDLGSGGVDELSFNDDFDLESSGDESRDVATWDDSQRMDQLLAGVEDMPSDEFDRTNEDVAAETKAAPAVKAGKWSPEETVSLLTRAGTPRRKRSFATTFAMSTVGGLAGLALGYYALLWISGPTADFLNWANHLPKAILPGSFSGKSHVVAAAPALPTRNENTPPTVATNEPVAPANEAAKAEGAAADSKSPRPEQQASFNAPATGGKPSLEKAEPAPTGATTVNKPAEPAPLETPTAVPLPAAEPAPEPLQISNTPSFTEKELVSAIAAGQEASPNLINGKLSESVEIKRKKGASYAILADLAQKVTFVDPTAPDVAQLRKNADAIFGETLTSPHAREEVAQIVPLWLQSSKRQHGGVFFAGNVVGQESNGSYSICSFDLGNGQSLPVIMPMALGERIKTYSGPVAVVGWLIEKPAENIKGFKGTAPQAVFAGRVLALPAQ